ncbi:Na(+)/H(+) exchange regulatory cofactor NHE-RF1-like [Sinocyclocheilus anshuiensis]|uniref:Na(+)/H(+) exchange regulatory cofactor NHE-RF n=1 Tax=Sinocyclocheilus anshuiensis TaxID=1608454 RepID=A0A671M2F2_9TELE|nr:PREDICTED: Na(+)/H(+) exchange regulatory cofactor NHE-RF1-like [Sinocyclocheilus anshuiensis]
MSSDLRPKLCVLEKGDDGYGFHLHGEKNKLGQFIRHVEADSPAAEAGLMAGDKLAFVNGENVEDEKHQQVVSRIRGITGKLELIVVDAETANLLQKHNMKCQKEYLTDGIPIPSSAESGHEEEMKNGTPRESTPVPETNGDIRMDRLSVSSKESKNELRPRLCHMKKGATGYGFNLHTEKSKPGQYIRAVDEDSPAEKSGLRPQDKIVEVNGVPVYTMHHSEVVATIKAGGDETRLLVVDPETDAFFRSCDVLPTENHLTGPLPESLSSRDAEDQVNGKASQEEKPKVAMSLSTSSTSSNTSSSAAPASTSAPEEKPKAKASSDDAGLSLNISLQQAKERAHQKRSNKRAPQMDWSKRNELFSNL